MNLFKDYFYYTKNERLAVLFLCTCIVLFVSVRLTQYLTVAPPPTSMPQWDNELLAFEAHQSQFPEPQRYPKKSSYQRYAAAHTGNSFGGNTRSVQAKLRPQPFDPNTVSAEKLAAMNVPERSIKSIINYRNKGGKFKYKEDLARIYTLESNHYDTLKDYLQLPEKAAAPVAQALPAAFDFDPNTCSRETFAALGLSPRTIKSIINYRSKGGSFRQAEDFKKIYSLPDSLYQHLAAHIQLVEQPQNRTPYTRPKRVYRAIDINTASSEDFEQFRGIGATYARRLLEWRDKLGGFVDVTQVGELYQLPDSTFQQMLPHLTCTGTPLLQINVNTATLEQLKAHPYLRWAQAKAIVQYRERKGPWKSVALLEILPELDDGKNTFERIRPYLRVR